MSELSVRNRVGRRLRRWAFRLHLLADSVDPHPVRLIEAGSGRRGCGCYSPASCIHAQREMG